MSAKRSMDPVKDTALYRAYFDSRKWIPFYEQLPKPGVHVLVKMADGRVFSGSWDAKAEEWTHSPFEQWGAPVSWSMLRTAKQSA